jgi:ABC-2 type transport system permease protein
VKPLLAQVRLELALTLRNGESMLLTLGIPVGILVFFSLVDVLPIDGDPVAYLAPGVLALAVLSTAFANLAIATGFDRSYGVLKRLGTTPLGRGRLVGAKVLSSLTVLGIQAVVIVGAALALGWAPKLEPLPVLASVVLSTVAFVGMALFLAGRLPALLNLAVSNAIFLALLMFSGMVFPLKKLPIGMRHMAQALPSTALSEALHGAFTKADVPVWVWPVLLAWSMVAVALAVVYFRWEPDR